MKLLTEILIPSSLVSITYDDRILTLGSCFAENIGSRLQHYGFDTDVNPFGILYNPLSVGASVQRLLSGKWFDQSELFLHNGLWHSFMHHGSFSAPTPEAALEKINSRFAAASEQLNQTDFLLVTFGTAWTYRTEKENAVVSNCHKLPARFFQRYRLTVDEIVALWTSLLEQLRQLNPKLKLLFTVSPIRHWKDGAHENQLSKAVLLLAIDRLKDQFDVAYFPAYELMMDELRDYRFYATDMLHPSDQAIDYIWERFATSCFHAETREIMSEVGRLHSALAHRPLNPDTDEYRRFREQTLIQKTALLQRFPKLHIK